MSSEIQNLKQSIQITALGDDIIAVECASDYSRSKPSFLVPPWNGSTRPAEETEAGHWTLQTATNTLRVEADENPWCIRIFRNTDGQDASLCEFRAPSPCGSNIAIDRGYELLGAGGNNAQTHLSGHDLEPLKDIDLNRNNKLYCIHHRKTGQGNNYMPWVLSSQGFGLFIDSSFPLKMDLRDGFLVEGSNIRCYYFINGPTPAEALQRFVEFLGLPPMHPAWALGYEQSTRSWMGPGELDFVTTYFREKQIPCDGLDLLVTYDGKGGVGKGARGIHQGYLDYHQGWHRYGTYREYNPKLLPGGAEDLQKLRQKGFRPIVHNYFKGDYSDPEDTERVWQEQKFLMEDGFSGWWLDGAEGVEESQAHHQKFSPKDPEKYESGEFRDEYDNIWALLRAKAFYEKQRRDFPNQRVYILNRTAFPGLQHYAGGVNQGDFWSSWELLETQTVWLLNMGMSGIFFPQSDIGGHWPTEHLTDELFIRWAFLATFAPLMRSHGHNWRCRLPWGFGPENEARFVPLIRLRSALFPYNYTLLREANQSGIPLMRAMVLEYPDDRVARKLWTQYMWGSHFLVAPVIQKGAREREVYLPEGRWLHFWTYQVYEGESLVRVAAPLGKDPLFVKMGAVIPMREPSNTIPSESETRMLLLLLPSGKEGQFSFTLYDDDRESYRYEEGEFSEQTFTISSVPPEQITSGESAGFELQIGKIEGQHRGIKHQREYRIELPKSLFMLDRVLVQGKEIPRIESESGQESTSKPYWQALDDKYVLELPATENSRVIFMRKITQSLALQAD